MTQIVKIVQKKYDMAERFLSISFLKNLGPASKIALFGSGDP